MVNLSCYTLLLYIVRWQKLVVSKHLKMERHGHVAIMYTFLDLFVFFASYIETCLV